MRRWLAWPRLLSRPTRRRVDGARVSVEGPFLVGPLSALPAAFQRRGLVSGAVFTALVQLQLAVVVRERGVAFHRLMRRVESVARSLVQVSTRAVGLGGHAEAAFQYGELCWLEDNLRSWEEEFGLTFSWLRSGVERCRRPVCPVSLGTFWQVSAALGLTQVTLVPSDRRTLPTSRPGG